MNINCRNKFTQWTPLMTAAVSGEICTARVLFKYNADGQLKNTAGTSASQIARKPRSFKFNYSKFKSYYSNLFTCDKFFLKTCGYL